jgi:hypothetical protein
VPANLDVALAENVIRAGQAAWWYSLRMPPKHEIAFEFALVERADQLKAGGFGQQTGFDVLHCPDAVRASPFAWAAASSLRKVVA